MSFFRIPNLPSIVWVFLMIGGVIALIGGIIFFFTLLATLPGFASFIFILIGLAYVFSPSQFVEKDGTSGDAIFKAIGVGFFALMGMAIDQPGNFIYNYPLRYLCPPESSMSREVNVSHPLPGRTDMTQDFRCVNARGKLIERIGMEKVIALRFFEYLILAYVFIGLKDLKKKQFRETVSIDQPKNS